MGDHDYDDDMDYDLPDSRHGSAGRRLKPLNSKSTNHYLPHDRLKAVSDDRYAHSVITAHYNNTNYYFKNYHAFDNSLNNE